MNNKRLLMIALSLLAQSAAATDYTVDFSRVDNLESIRPLVEGCADFDALELYRHRLETTADLEDMRGTLSGIGFGLFIDCPAGISATGISAVPTRKASQTTGYSVNFTRVADFESLRPLVSGCSDFGALEHFRDRMEATTNLEEMRDSLTEVGFGMFDDCPAGVSGPGITPVK